MASALAIILAAGKGTRMKSRLPKVLHKLGGKYMAEHVFDAVRASGVEEMVAVVGHAAEMVQEALGDGLMYAIQEEQLGTGHAVMKALPCIRQADGIVLVACGDTPLIRAETFRSLIEFHRESGAVCTVLSARLPDPAGYGRVIRNSDSTVARIVEQKDAAPEELVVNEINTGTYCFDLNQLREAVKTLTCDNAQGEYYLTDTISFFVSQGWKVEALVAEDFEETFGINSRMQLAEADAVLRSRKIFALMEDGVTIIDPGSTFIDTDVQVGQDTVIEPFTFLRGNTRIGSECRIGPHCDISNCILGNEVQVSRSTLVESEVEDRCTIGPFAYLRPGTILHRQVKVGDFVEIKKSEIGEGSKVPHLSYVGDARVGRKVNIGCGTITCNYDGKTKHPTVIGDGAFIGSNSNLVAPVTVGKGAMTGAGSTITKNVPDGDLALERSQQVYLTGWAERWFRKQPEDKK